MPSPPRIRFPLAAFAAFALLTALWAGLQRMGWDLPALHRNLPGNHGALMVSGFLGTLIGLERAVALKRRWAFLVPLLSAAGSLALLADAPGPEGRLLIATAGAGMLVVYTAIYRIQPAMHTIVMGAGAGLWLIGNLLWLGPLPLYRVVPWWAGFLVLTIVGERIELVRMLRLTAARRVALLAAIGVFVAGLVVSVFLSDVGTRVAGIGLLAQGLWLMRYDLARHTLRRPGVTRFIALALLVGYAWLMAAGGLWLGFGQEKAGAWYDAMLHTVFLGFVMSMIFGHAPVILPSALGFPMPFAPAFYAHLTLLHVSLAVRITGDLIRDPVTARWGGLLNVAAVLLFAFNTIRSVRAARRSDGANRTPPGGGSAP